MVITSELIAGCSRQPVNGIHQTTPSSGGWLNTLTTNSAIILRFIIAVIVFLSLAGSAHSAPDNPARTGQSAAVKSPRNQFHKRNFSRAQVLLSQDSAPDKHWRIKRKRIIREESLKYPIIRLNQSIQLPSSGRVESADSEEVIISQEAMAADHIIVTLKDGVSEDKLKALNLKHGAKILRKMYAPNQYLISLNEYNNLEAIENAVDKYASEASIISSAGPDYIWSALLIPDDTNFAPLWALRNTGQLGGTPNADIDADEAWNIATGSRDVAIAIIDSGIDYTHPDLAANMWVNPGEIPGNHKDDDKNGFVDDINGWDFVHNDKDPMDDYGHGTYCAGITGAVGNNATGIVGVNWQVSLVALKFLDSSGSGYDSDAIECVQYATANGIKITSNSWGGFPNSPQLRNAISAANTAGVLFIAGAGNAGSDNDVTPFYPASYDLDNVISVANTTDMDELSSSSNYGATSVDIAAPGTSILSTELGGGYVYGGGTSAAAPFVSGACALLWSHETDLSASQVKNRILDRADNLPSLMGVIASARRLNAFNMINPSWTAPEPRVIVDVISLTDDGDYDNHFEIGETVEILTLLTNEYFPDAVNVNLQLSSSNPNVTVLLPDSINPGTIGGFESIEPATPLKIELGSGLTGNELVEYTLTVSYDPAYQEDFVFSFTVSPGDPYEPDDILPIMDTIDVGETQNRSIHVIDDTDWVAFTLPRADEIRIKLDGPEADDTELFMYGPGWPGTFLKYDDNSGPGLFSQINRTGSDTLSPGTYYLKIIEKGMDSVIDDYTLTVERFSYPIAVPEALPADGFAPLDITFSNPGSYDPDGEAISEWEWKLGAEIISTSSSFTHNFNFPGIYNLILRIKNVDGVWSDPAALEVTAWIPGDANKDGTVNLTDFVLLRNAFGSDPLSTNWNPDADFNGSGAVNLDDFILLRNNFGESL